MNELHRAEYDRIVKNTAVDAAKISLEEGCDDFDESLDAAMWNNDPAKQAIKFQPLRVIEYAASVKHWDQLMDPGVDQHDPDKVLDAMARRGFEYDVYEMWDAIMTVSNDPKAVSTKFEEIENDADA